MPITVNDNFRNNTPKSLDNKFLKNGLTPYVSVAEANATIPQAYRSPGLPVFIDDGSGRKEYWYRDGVTDVHLIQKTVDAGGAGQGNLFI